METLYWIFEYGKVLWGYMFFMFLWPSVVFSKHLRSKDKVYRFSFCVLAQVIIANSVVLVLGLLHILNQWVVFGIFHGIFLISVVKKLNFQYRSGLFHETLSSVYRFIMGTSGIKTFLFRMIGKAAGWFRRKLTEKFHDIHSHLLEYIVLLAVVLYGMLYFSWGSFQSYGYFFSDMYVHHQWIDGLLKGEIFVSGVYPEAMHCFVYCVNTLFGIQVYSCIQLMGGIHIVVYLISAYCLMREIFQWKYTPIFVLAVFLTLDTAVNLNFIVSMSRLQSMLPQEFGMYTQFLCALFLIRYLKSTKKSIYEIKYKDKNFKYYWNEDLFLFVLALADSIAIHFYITIMAFLLCVPFALFFIKRIFTKERFIPLVAAVICGVLIAVLPMGGALASGKEFQGSIGWALGVMGVDMSGKSMDKMEKSGNNKEREEESENINSEAETKLDDTELIQKVEKKLLVLWKGYTESYGEKRAMVMVACMGCTILLLFFYQAGMIIWQKVLKHSAKVWYFQLYFPMIFTSILFMVAEKSSALGLPQLIERNRIYSIEHILLLITVVMPVDMLFVLLKVFCTTNVLQLLSVLGTIGIYYVTIALGNYHGFLMEYLTRYDSAVMVTNSIIKNFTKNKYTIVSPVDELYQVSPYGRHEELLTFVQEIQEEDYKLPTDYVFLFIEKKPIEYMQIHFFSGPSWLGSTKYSERYPYIYIHPDVVTRKISEEDAMKDILFFNLLSQSYSNLRSRTILESKAYLWCQNFAKIHPFEVHVYYEDENFVCYYFKQNPYALYDLAIEDWDRMDGIQW